ncbi:MAG: hypothetical protein LBG98_00460 [Puniceicoccales bacterium]|jgi:hypothetical protein|nr:hypothetical protein [Puniceicoccales bacterium]
MKAPALHFSLPQRWQTENRRLQAEEKNHKTHRNTIIRHHISAKYMADKNTLTPPSEILPWELSTPAVVQ